MTKHFVCPVHDRYDEHCGADCAAQRGELRRIGQALWKAFDDRERGRNTYGSPRPQRFVARLSTVRELIANPEPVCIRCRVRSAAHRRRVCEPCRYISDTLMRVKA